MTTTEKILRIETITTECHDATADIRQQMSDLEATIAGQISILRQEQVNIELQYVDEYTALVAEVKREVIDREKTCKGNRLQIIFAKPTTKWDTKKLNRYAETNPDVLEFRTTGKPSTRVKWEK